LGNKEGLAISLANQDELIAQKMGKPREALPLVEEVYDLAIKNSLSALSQQIKPILDAIKDMMKSSDKK
jgi:hypothetical protein